MIIKYLKKNKFKDILTNMVATTNINIYKTYEFKLFARILSPILFICAFINFLFSIMWGYSVAQVLPMSTLILLSSYLLMFLSDLDVSTRKKYILYSLFMTGLIFYAYYLIIDMIGILFWIIVIMLLLPTLILASNTPYLFMFSAFIITSFHFVVTNLSKAHSDDTIINASFFIVFILLFIEGQFIKQIINRYLMNRIQHNSELLSQNEEISALYEEISASEEELREVNQQLVTYNNTIIKNNEELNLLANTDMLTHLPNRKKFFECVTKLVDQDERFYIVFIDLDDFKKVNDSFGHHIGDLFLIEQANIIASTIDEVDTLFKIGGDEFAVLVNQDITHQQFSKRINIMQNRFIEGVTLQGYSIRLTASFGIARFPDNGNDAASVLSAADSAMFRAKEKGKSSHHFYDHSLGEHMYDHFSLQNSLYEALEKDDFYLVFQPLHANHSQEITSFEALLRYKSKEHGTIYPDVFIPLLEETGLIEKVGYWIIEEVANFANAINDTYHSTFRFAINISAKQIFKENFYDQVVAIFKKTNADPGLFIFEVTESVLINDLYTAQQTLNRLRAIGVTFAIDDFGTGYSSLSYLVDLPVDILKIDKFFIQQIDEENKHKIVDGIISISKTLDLKIVAEGVETEEQLDYLDQSDCTSIQGYYYSKPLESAQVGEYIKKNPYHIS